MRVLLALLLTLPFAIVGFAQDITVHVINDGTKKPLKNIYLNLRVDCENPHRPNALQQKTDASGMAVFRSISLNAEPICVDLFSVAYAYAPRQLDYIFVLPDKADRYRKSLNPIITALPADVTFPVRKRSFSERLHFMFMGD